eukprot:symbB.v1.2.009582.t1/scaffold611.1/size181545/5
MVPYGESFSPQGRFGLAETFTSRNVFPRRQATEETGATGVGPLHDELVLSVIKPTQLDSADEKKSAISELQALLELPGEQARNRIKWMINRSVEDTDVAVEELQLSCGLVKLDAEKVITMFACNVAISKQYANLLKQITCGRLNPDGIILRKEVQRLIDSLQMYQDSQQVKGRQHVGLFASKSSSVSRTSSVKGTSIGLRSSTTSDPSIEEEKEHGCEVIWERVQGFVGPYLKSIAEWWEGFKCSQLLSRLMVDHAFLGMDEEHYKLHADRVSSDELCEHRKDNNLLRILWKIMLSNTPILTAIFCILAFVLNRSVLDALRLLLVVFACLRLYPFPANWLWSFLKYFSAVVLVLRTLYDLPVVCAGFQLRQPRGADVTRLVLEPDDSYQWCPVFTTIGIDILLGFSKRSTVSALEAVEIWIDVVWADHLCIWAILMHQWMLQRFGVGRFVTFDAQSQRLWLRKTSSQPGTPTNSVKEVKLKDESLGTWGATFRELHTETWCKLDGAEQREIARVHEVIAALASREVRVWARAILLPFVHKKKGRAQKLQIHELLQALSSRNQPEMLHTVLEELRQETGLLDLRNYTAALTAYSKSNHWRLASEVFSKMIADKIQPDVMSFTAVIGAHARGSCVEGARELFNAMADHVVQPNVFSYSACISAYEKMGRWKEPLELPLGFLYGLHKDFITINLAMFKWKAHQWQLGLCFFSDSSAKLADRITFNVAISLCGKVSQWRRALDIFQSMQSYAQDVSMSPDVVTFSSLISACQKAFQWQQACLLFYVMGSFKVAPNLTCFNALISICDAWRYTNGEIKLWMEG